MQVIGHIKKSLLFIVLSMIILTIFACSHDEARDGVIATVSTPGSSRLSELLGSDGVQGFPLAIEPRAFSFPEDHGPHPEYRNEWWYVTGNLDANDGRRFGYELTLFRFALAPEPKPQSAIRSDWATEQVYIGHFAITDVEAGEFHVGQRYSRGAAGLAGADSEPFNVWLDDWHIKVNEEGAWTLKASDENVEIEVDLAAIKAPVLNGKEGLSQKSDREGNASYYYSITRLETRGRIRIDDEEYPVSGTSWLDREWGSSALSRQQVGWDWFALQLSDGRELMFYNLRRDDGSVDHNSAGTMTSANGSYEYLSLSDVNIEVQDHWESEFGGRYPSRWSISIPDRQLEIDVTPVLANQELSTTVRYWEGAVDVRGRAGDEQIDGRGYVELTGYAAQQ